MQKYDEMKYDEMKYDETDETCRDTVNYWKNPP